MTVATSGILQDCDPAAWREHRFGLPSERWDRLAGRGFWITGSGTGFGRAIAVALALARARVALTGRRAGKLVETRGEAAALGASPDTLFPAPADVTDSNQLASVADAIASRGALHGFVHCAAISQRRSSPWPLQTEDDGYWNDILAVNLLGAWRLARAALPLMVSAGEARGLMLSSEAGWAFTPGFGHYNVSKAALNSLGGSLAEEIAACHRGVDVQINVLSPGEARTEMNQGSTRSPYVAVSMALTLLSHPPNGPNGRFFHADGRHLAFGLAAPHERSLLG